MEKLQQLYDEKNLTERWIFCLDENGDVQKKKPVVHCIQCENAHKCPSLEHYEDFPQILRECVENQNNPSLSKVCTEFIGALGERLGKNLLDAQGVGDESDESSDNTDDQEEGASQEETQDPPHEEVEEKNSKKKGKKKKARKKRGPRKADNKVDSEDKEDDKQDGGEKKVINALPDKFVLLPTKLDNPEARGFVTKDKLESLIDKFDKEGQEVAVFRIASHNLAKKKYDYLVVPSSDASPEIITYDELLSRIEDYDSEQIDIKIFEVGRQLQYRKEIIIEEAGS